MNQMLNLLGHALYLLNDTLSLVLLMMIITFTATKNGLYCERLKYNEMFKVVIWTVVNIKWSQ